MAQMQKPCRSRREACNNHGGNLKRLFQPWLLFPVRAFPPPVGAATDLVVLVHGYGADGNDLIGLARIGRTCCRTDSSLPMRRTLCPARRPAFNGFPFRGIDPHEMRDGVAMAAPALDEFLDAELARLESAAGAAGAGRIQPGHHAGAASGARAPGRRPPSSAFPGLLAGAAAGSQAAPADSSHPWRQRHRDSRPTPCSRRPSRWARPGCRCNGIWRRAWGMASTRKGSTSPGLSGPGLSGRLKAQSPVSSPL